MGIWRLVTREILHRKLNFALGVFSVLVAVGVLVSALGLLDSHEIRTRHILDDMEARKQAEMRQLQDDYRRIMTTLGLNVLILPKKQDPTEFHRLGRASEYMPERYVQVLSESRVVTVRHLLPTLEQMTDWPERAIEIRLIGTRGEVPVLHRDKKRPIVQPVESGTILVASGLHDLLGLKVDDKVTLKGLELTVAAIRTGLDPKDYRNAWVHLAQAQDVLDKRGLINAIWALECRCAWAEIDKVKEEIRQILPDTEVYEMPSLARTRRDARERARLAHETAIAEQKLHRARLGRQRRKLVTWLVPLAIVGCAVWIGLLAFSNVRQRRGEIGILRAIGVRGRHILAVFLARAALVGALGACLGYGLGFVVATFAGGVASDAAAASALFHGWLLGAVLGAAPLLAALASWAPAIVAAQQDPAVVLSKE